MQEYLAILFGLVFVQNFVLSQFLGLCPFIGVSKNRSSALGMGLAVVFVMVLASLSTMILYKGLFEHPALKALEMGNYLDIVSFILVIAGLVQFVEIVMKKVTPALYQTLGIYLPLITTNCTILGATQMNVVKFGGMSFAESLAKSAVLSVAGGIGFTLALFLMAGIRERLENAPLPESMKGVPIAFIAAAGMALAFLGFQGIV